MYVRHEMEHFKAPTKILVFLVYLNQKLYFLLIYEIYMFMCKKYGHLEGGSRGVAGKIFSQCK